MRKPVFLLYPFAFFGKTFLKFPYAGRIKKPSDLLKQPFQDVCRLLGQGAFHLMKRVFLSRPGTPQPVGKLLVRRNRLGDAICLLPAIQALKDACPGIHVAVLANPYNAPVFALFSAIDRVHVLPERYLGNRWLLRWHPVMRAIRSEKYDLAVSATLTPSSHSARLCWYSGVLHRAGIASARGSVYDLLFDCPVSPSRISSVHQVEKIADLLRLAGLNIGPVLPAIRLVPQQPSPPRLGNLVCLCPEVHRRESEWPVEYYASLIAELRRRWPTIRIQVVLQSPQSVYARLAGLAGAEMVRTSNFQDFVMKLAECSLVICSEGGASHLAPALGVPTMVLSGMTIRQTWSPWSDQAVLLESAGDASRIGVDEVLAGIAAFVAQGRCLLSDG
jgi:ADP-heptose:LPS heptosyltransferase